MIAFRFVVLQFCAIGVLSFIDFVFSFQTTTTEDPSEVVNSVNAYYDESSDSIFVNWTKPLETNGILRGYSVKLVHVMWQGYYFISDPPIAFNVSSKVNSVVFNSTQIKFYSLYEVYVAAITDKKEPEMKRIITTPRSSPELVRSLTAHFDESSKTIVVKWLKPLETKGMLRGYNVRLIHGWWEHSCKVPVPEIDLNVSSEVNSVVFNSTQFKFSSAYIAFVAAIADKIGPELMKIILTPESIPEAAPKNLTVTSLTTTGYTIKWETPDCAFFNINRDGIPIKSQYTSTSISYTNLVPNTEYENTIISCTIAGCGKQTASITVTTLALKPEAPIKLELENSTTTSLFISWMKPVKSNGDLINYRIKATLIDLNRLRRMDGQIVYSFIEDNSNVTVHNITGLQPRSTYNVTVEAATSGGFGPPVQELFHTRNSEPKYLGPEVVKITKDSVQDLMDENYEIFCSSGFILRKRTPNNL